MNLDISYQEFLKHCEKTTKNLGEQIRLSFTWKIEWFDLSKRDSKDPEKETGKETDIKETDDAGRIWMSTDYDIDKCTNLLDFGSGSGTSTDSNGTSFLTTCCENYYSLDDDPKCNSVFKSFNDIPEDLMFDAIVAHHCLEHVNRDSICSVMSSLCSKLEKNGVILVVVPNIYNWSSYVFNLDHILPLGLDSIGAFLYMNNVEPVKAYLASKSWGEYSYIHNSYQDADREKIMNVLTSIYDIHPAKQLAVVGIKR